VLTEKFVLYSEISGSGAGQGKDTVLAQISARVENR